VTGARITAKLDDVALLGALGRLRQVATVNIGMMRAIGVGLVTTTAQRMDRGVDPDGNAWTALSPAYARRKHGPGILRESLMLQRSVTFLAGPAYVVVGSNRRYAAIHQFGGRIEREPSEHTIYRKVKDGEFARGGRFVKKGASNFATKHYMGAYVIMMPARPYLGFGPEEQVVTLDVLDDAIARALKG
jgi:phage virion morphogenesis protein